MWIGLTLLRSPLPESLLCPAGRALGRAVARGHLGYECAKWWPKPGIRSSPGFISRVPKAGLKPEVVFAAAGGEPVAGAAGTHTRVCAGVYVLVQLPACPCTHVCAYTPTCALVHPYV